MEIASQIATLIATVFAIVGPIAYRGRFARRHAWIIAIREQADTIPLPEEAREQLRDEAARAVLWDLARRKYPGRASLLGPLVASIALAPVMLVANYPLNTNPAWLSFRPLTLAVFIVIAIWTLVRMGHSEAEWTRWKLCQLNGGADIDAITPRKLRPELARLARNMFRRNRNRRRQPTPFVAILHHATVDHRAECDDLVLNPAQLPDLDNYQAWEDLASRVPVELVNATITADTWQDLRLPPRLAAGVHEHEPSPTPALQALRGPNNRGDEPEAARVDADAA